MIGDSGDDLSGNNINTLSNALSGLQNRFPYGSTKSFGASIYTRKKRFTESRWLVVACEIRQVATTSKCHTGPLLRSKFISRANITVILKMFICVEMDRFKKCLST